LSGVPPQASQQLRRRLGFWLLVLYGIGTIVGAGIYVLVGQVIGHAGPTAPFAFLIAGGLAALTGLSYAELSSRYPEAAGAAAYIGHGFGRADVARVAGFAAALTGAIAAASIARGSAAYLRHFIDLPEPLLATAVVVLFSLIACLNVTQSVTVAAVHTVIEVGGLLLVIAIGAPAFAHLPSRLPEMVPDSLAGAGGTLAGAFVAFFAYAGFETMANMAEETRDPRRTMPRAIVAALAAASVLYTLAVLVVLLGVPPDVLARSETPLALVISDVEWNAPALIAAIAVFATANGVLVELLMVSRMLFGMAERGWAPGFLGRVTRRTRIPLNATLVAAAVGLALVLVAPIEPLAEATSTVLLALFGTVNLALWRLKRKHGRHTAGFHAPSWVAPLGCVLSFAMIPAQFLA
jgi:amino acid transporter